MAKKDHHIKFEQSVNEHCAFLITLWNFKKQKFKHDSMLSTALFSSETLTIKVYVDWREVLPDIDVCPVENGWQRLFQLLREHKIDQSDHAYYPKERLKNYDELTVQIGHQCALLKRAMPHILKTEPKQLN